MDGIPVMKCRLADPHSVLGRLKAAQEQGTFANHGPLVRELEERYAHFLGVGAERVVAVSSGSLGLQGAVSVSERPRWIVPAFSFPAAIAAVVHSRREALFADIRADDWWIDVHPHDVDRDDTGIVAVAPFGADVELDRWPADAEVIVDAAASLGAGGRDLSLLPPGWAVVYSLHATKVLGVGEGGLVVFGDVSKASRMRAWINFGFSGSRESSLVGTNAKMSEVTAAYAHAALDQWPDERAEWKTANEIGRRLEREFNLAGQPGSLSGVRPYWIVKLADQAATEALSRALETEDVGTRRWWSDGCHRMPAFQDVPRRDLPVTEQIARRYLGLPMFRDLSETHAEHIHRALSVALRSSGAA